MNGFSGRTPPGRRRYTPWFEVVTRNLSTTLVEGDHFDLSLSHVTMAVLDCKCARIIKYSPRTTYFGDAGGGRMFVARNERTQKIWQIEARPGMLSNYRALGEHKEGWTWTYTHNDEFFPPVSAFDFHGNGPSALFALDQSPGLPQLEFEMVNHWTSSIPPSSMFSFLREGIEKPRPPAFRNFLHHVSVGVDLAKGDYGMSSATTGPNDHIGSMSSGVTHLDPIETRAESEDSDSEAIYGRVEPSTNVTSKLGRSIGYRQYIDPISLQDDGP